MFIREIRSKKKLFAGTAILGTPHIKTQWPLGTVENNQQVLKILQRQGDQPNESDILVFFAGIHCWHRLTLLPCWDPCYCSDRPFALHFVSASAWRKPMQPVANRFAVLQNWFSGQKTCVFSNLSEKCPKLPLIFSTPSPTLSISTSRAWHSDRWSNRTEKT